MNAIKLIIKKNMRGLLLWRQSKSNLTPFKFLYKSLQGLFFLLTFLTAAVSHAACSSYQGKVVINEYNYISNWIELKILDTSVIAATTQFADWKLWVFKQSPAKSTSQPVGSMYSNIADNTCGTSSTQYYIRIPFSAADLDNDVNVVLADKDNNIVNVFRLDQTAPMSTYFTGFNSCTVTYSNLTDAPATGSASNKDIARLPDGTGPWVISNGTGANSQQTLCGSNDALFKLTKTPSTASIGIGSGSTFTWTITAQNGGSNGDLSNVTISDTLPANMFLSACPTGATCAGTAGAYTSFSINTGTTLKPIGSTPNSVSVTATAYVTAAGTYTNTARVTATEVSPGYVEATGTVATASAPGSFNAFESATLANAITGKIYTKLAGTAFALDVVAISGGSQATSFGNNVKVELLANTGTVGSGYGADNCPTSNTVIQTIASSSITGGRSAISFSAVANAYRDVRVRISYPTTSPTVTSCSTDSFAIRPSSFAITSSDATNNAKTGTPVIKAGASFNLTATALAGYAGTPLVDNTKVVGTTTAGTLGGSFAAADSATGIATGSSFTYSEVGNFGLNAYAVYDSTFTSVDQAADCTADFSNTLVSGKYGCSIGSVAVAQTTGSSGFGRFMPDHFDTAVVLNSGVPMSCATIGLTSCPTLYNGFVYAGQAFTTQITARNLAGATTTNYNNTAGYSKAVTLSAWDTLGSTTTQNPGPGSLANSSVAASVFSNGVASVTNTSYTFTTIPTAPTNIYLRAQDTDNVTSLRTIAANSVEGGVKVVNGRIKISNAYGSELLPLSLTASAQYYNGSSWLSNASDAVTTLTFPAIFAVGTGSTAVTLVPVSGVLSGGVLTVNLAKPTNGAGIATITPATAPTYLPVISGTATFGIYKNNNNFIYQRESY